MQSFVRKVEIRWSDLDPNFHVLHSRYYDFGAFCRMAFLVEAGLTPAVMLAHHFGPIIFREECKFKKEIAFGDDILINFTLRARTRNYGRWTMEHEIWKNSSTLAALIQVDGAWMDTRIRKLTVPPEELLKIFDEAPRSSAFHMID